MDHTTGLEQKSIDYIELTLQDDEYYLDIYLRLKYMQYNLYIDVNTGDIIYSQNGPGENHKTLSNIKEINKLHLHSTLNNINIKVLSEFNTL